jgi:hypothetical protein
MPIYPLRYDQGRREGRVLIEGVEITLSIPQQLQRLALQLGAEVDESRAVGWPHPVTGQSGLHALADIGQAVVDAQVALKKFRQEGSAEGWDSVLAMLRRLTADAEAMALEARRPNS